MRRRHFLGQLLLVAGAGVSGTTAFGQADTTIGRRLRFALTFKNPKGESLQQQKFWGYLPANIPGRQTLQGIQVSMPHQLESDPLGHNILALDFESFPPFAQKVVILNMEVSLNTLAGKEILLHPGAWLAPERYIEADDPRITRLGMDLRRKSPAETGYAIFDWVRQHLNYAGYLAEDMGALRALLELRGDCTEYATLAVALARANGIPARMAGGYVMEHDGAPRPQDYHNWAELYFDGAWHLLDAQKGNWLQPMYQYVAFRLYRDVVFNKVGLFHRHRMTGELQLGF